jgi:hypothetical protein
VRFVGVTADGASIVVERDGEHLVLPINNELRSAISGQVQMPMPLGASVSPREIQRRIRAGESAARIAADCGVPVERVARFEGPVLAERDHQVERARAALVDGVPLAERIATVDDRLGTSSWDSWLAEDGGWRVRATWPDGSIATWAWEPSTRRVRALDGAARSAQEAQTPQEDDLEAVLRPIAAARHVSLVAAAEPQPEPADVAEAEVEHEGEDVPATDAERPSEPARPVAHKRRRASVPSWEQITGGRPTGPPAG